MKIIKKILSDIKYHNIIKSVSGTEIKNFIHNKKDWWNKTSFNKKNFERIKESYNNDSVVDNDNYHNENLRIGSAVHCLLLEPKKFEQNFIIIEGDDSNKSKTYLKIFNNEVEEALKENKSYLYPYEYKLVKEISDSIKSHKLYEETIKNSLKMKLTEFQIIISNLEYYDQDKEKLTKYNLKGKLDIVNLTFNENNEITEIKIGDIKTTSQGVEQYTNIYSFEKTYNVYQCLYYEYLVKKYIEINNGFFGKYKVAKNYEINNYYIIVDKKNLDVLFMNVDLSETNYYVIEQSIVDMVKFDDKISKNHKFSHKERFYKLKYKQIKNNNLEEEESDETLF